MRLRDLFRFAASALTVHGLRTGLSVVGVSIGVAAVLVLTALGDGAKKYVVEQFASLGTNLLIVLPGRTETTGSLGVGGVPNDLTLQDAEALQKSLASAERVAPVSMGTGEISYGERGRQLAVVGTTREYFEARDLELSRGEFLPEGDWTRGSPVVVLGATAARELFDEENPVGKIIRVGGWRMRVIGVLASQGSKLGIDFDDVAAIPVATAMQMLNRSSLFRIIVQVRSSANMDATKALTLGLLTERHGEEDITVLTQDSVIATFSSILGALTLAVGAIAGISLSVAGLGIMNVMLVSVSERTREIGLLKAIGAGKAQILGVFLTEAALLSTLGGVIGLALGFGLVELMVHLYPQVPASPPQWAVASAFGISVAVGVIFGILPARRATMLDPVSALSGR